MATSSLESKSTTVALSGCWPGGCTVTRYEPATTWALVSIRSCPTGQAEPARAPPGPPQPYAITRETSASAVRTPAVSVLAGRGSSGRVGERPVKGLGSSLFWRNSWTLARKAGGSGAMSSRPRSIAELSIWLPSTVRELLTNVKPRNQAMKSTPRQLVKVPATESHVASRVRRVRTRARYPKALPIPSMMSRAATKMPVATRGWPLLCGPGEIHRVSGGAISAPTTLPTTRPASAEPAQVKPRRYPEMAKPTSRIAMMASRMSIRSRV